MKNNMSEIERRRAAIDALPAEVLTPEDEASLAAAETEDDGTIMTLSELKQRLSSHDL